MVEAGQPDQAMKSSTESIELERRYVIPLCLYSVSEDLQI